VTTVARATDDNLTEITIDTKALDGYGMISETSEDSTSEAKELPGICKRNLGHQAVVQPETLKLKRYILKPNSSIVTTLHGQHWSTLVNIGQHWSTTCTVPSESPAKNCRLAAVGAQAKLARIRHASPGEHDHQ